jgi:hypothetical protein
MRHNILSTIYMRRERRSVWPENWCSGRKRSIVTSIGSRIKLCHSPTATEHRNRGFSEDKLEVLMRDSTVTSNMSAIMSGYTAHILATNFGPVGPFKGAVASTFVVLLLVTNKWQENCGSNNEEECKSVRCHLLSFVLIIIINSVSVGELK